MTQNLLIAGERLWNGVIVSPALAEAYNRASDRIASFEAAGLPVPEQLLNGRHNLLPPVAYGRCHTKGNCNA